MEIASSKKVQRKCNKWKPILFSLNFILRKTKLEIFSSAGYPMWFVNSVIKDFEIKEPDPVIPSYLFNDFELKLMVLINVSFCNENEKVSKQLLKKLKAFTKQMYDYRIIWKTKKSGSFSLWKKLPYPSCKTYEGICSCKNRYFSLEWEWTSTPRFRTSQAILSTPWSCFSMESSDVSAYK